MQALWLVLAAVPPVPQHHVPAQFPDLQAAIDAAAPGDVILVASTVEQSVVVDKALTILGNPSFAIRSGCAWGPGCASCPPDESAFWLAGAGGTVTLGGFVTMSTDCDYPAPAIGGGGFDELHVHDATIEIVSGLSGLGHGADAIDVDVPFVLVSGSTIAAVGSGSDHCSGFLYPDETAGLRNPNGTVLLVDSEVQGGSGVASSLCCVVCGCPPMPDPAFGGHGGPGVVADQVFLAGATVTGGAGATFYAYPAGKPYDPVGTPIDCGSQPDGPAFVASAVHELQGTLTGARTASPGGKYVIAWDLPGPIAGLFFALGATAPMATASGHLFLDPATTSFLGSIATGAPASLAIAIPKSSALLGVEFAFQALDSTLGATRPIAGLVVP